MVRQPFPSCAGAHVTFLTRSSSLLAVLCFAVYCNNKPEKQTSQSFYIHVQYTQLVDSSEAL